MQDTRSDSVVRDRSRSPSASEESVPLTVQLPPHDAGDVFVVRLALTWTSVVSVEPLTPGVEVMGLAPDRANLRFALVPSGDPGGQIAMTLRFVGEPPQVDGIEVSRPAQEPPGAMGLSGRTPIADQYRARREHLERMFCGPRLAYARFFHDLDRATYYPLLEEAGDPRAPLFRDLATYLRRRIDRRAAFARYGLRFSLQPEDVAMCGAVQAVEPVFGNVVRSFLAGGESLDGAVFEFVNGGLEVALPGAGASVNVHGAPNTAVFFAFAEACFLFRDLGLDARGSWATVAKPFVVGAEVFTHLCWSGKGRTSRDYSWAFRRCNGDFDFGRWEALSSLFSRHGPTHLIEGDLVEECFGDIVARALRDDTLFHPAAGVMLAPSLPKSVARRRPYPPLCTQVRRSGLPRAPGDDGSGRGTDGGMLVVDRKDAAAMTTSTRHSLPPGYFTVEARCSNAQGQPYVPQPNSDLAAYWNLFQECVQDHPEVPEPAANVSREHAIWQHLQDPIATCMDDRGGSTAYTFETSHYLPSRQSSTGWIDPDGAAHCCVVSISSGAIVCYFGCEKTPP